MSNDILESVSQRGYGAYDAENRRIKEISDELQRLCRTMRKIEESEKSPMNSKDFADYMRHNLEQAKKIETASK